MDYLEFIDKDYTKIHMRLIENKDIFQYDILYDMGLIPTTIRAIWAGYYNSFVGDFLTATAYAGAYIALNAPELLTTIIDTDSDEVDYLTVLCNMMLYCEDLDLPVRNM